MAELFSGLQKKNNLKQINSRKQKLLNGHLLVRPRDLLENKSIKELDKLNSLI